MAAIQDDSQKESNRLWAKCFHRACSSGHEEGPYCQAARPIPWVLFVPGFCALLEGDLDCAAGGRWLARDLRLCLRFGGSEHHARPTLLSTNLNQEVPIPKAPKYQFPAFTFRRLLLAKREHGSRGRGVANHDQATRVFDLDYVAAGRQLRASYVEGERVHLPSLQIEHRRRCC